MALNLGELYGVLSLDDKPWNKAVDGAEEKLRSLGGKGKLIAAAAGVAVGAALAAGVIESMDVEAGTDKLAAQLGLTEAESERAGTAAGNLFSAAYGESLDEVNGAVAAVISSISGMRDASTADIEDMTARVLDLATAFEIDAGRAAQVAGQLITSGLANDGVHAADLLTVALQKVPAAVREDILDAADEYGPFFANLGISGEKAMGMLVDASEKGMYGIDKTGDALKEFGIRATDMSKATSGAYDAIGLDQREMTDQLLAGGDTAAGAFDKIVSGLQDMESPADRSAAAIALFGTPLEDLSVNEIPKFLGSLTDAETGLGDVSGASDDFGKQLNDNASTAITDFTRSLKTGFVSVVGGAVIPAITSAAKFLNTNLGPALEQVSGFVTGTVMPALSRFGQWMVDNQGTIGAIATVIGVLLIPVFIRLGVQALLSAAKNVTAFTLMQGGAIKTAAVYVAQSYILVASWVRMGVAAVVSGAQTVAIWTLYKLEALKGAAVYAAQSIRVAAAWVAMSTAAVVSGIKTKAVWIGTVVASAISGAASFVVQTARIIGGWVLMGAQAMIQAARMAAAWFIALGPVGWVIAAVIGLVALIIANWDKVSAWTKKAWSAVTDFVADAWKNITTGVTTGVTNAINFVRDGWNKAKSWTASIWNGIVDWISSIPGKILSGLSAIGRLYIQVGQWILSVKDAAVEKFLSLVDWVKGLPGRILSALGNLGQLLWDAGSQILGGLLGGLKDGFEGVKDFVGGIGQWIADNKGPKAYDQALLVPAGKWIMGGLDDSMQGYIPTLKKTLGGISSVIAAGIDPRLDVSGMPNLGSPSRRETALASPDDGAQYRDVHLHFDKSGIDDQQAVYEGLNLALRPGW